MTSSRRWDIFISHAGEDKELLAKPLAAALTSFGISVWYDEFTLRVGDSLSRSIDKGLSQSAFGVVVLSPDFFAKSWPEYELRGLTARELDEEKVILPIWHNVTRSDVLRFSPPLADKFALSSASKTPLQLAVAIIDVIKPELFTRIIRRMAHLSASRRRTVRRIAPELVRSGPVRHEELSPELIGRIRLVRAALLGIYTHSMKNWVDGFKRDAHPSKEVAVWERIASTVLEYCAINRVNAKQARQVFSLVLGIDSGASRSELENEASTLPAGSLDAIERIYTHSVPAYDIDEPNEFESDGPTMAATANEDREHFPNDLPNDLLNELIDERVGETTKPSNERPKRTSKKRGRLRADS